MNKINENDTNNNINFDILNFDNHYSYLCHYKYPLFYQCSKYNYFLEADYNRKSLTDVIIPVNKYIPECLHEYIIKNKISKKIKIKKV